MGCECGKREVDEEKEKKCQETALLESAENVHKEIKDQRIVGGCLAGHTPWYAFIKIDNHKKCGGTLINKFWVLSAGHCFCHRDTPKSVLQCRREGDQLIPAYDVTDENYIKVYVGATEDDENDQTKPAWMRKFKVAEMVLHYKYLDETGTDKKKVIRIDYDVALLRLDYPIKDPETGLGVLNSPGFDRKTIMPICLPPNADFKDTNRAGTAVGMGIKGEKGQSKRCFTNGKGPVVFQKCSPVYVYEHKRDERGDEDYYNAALHHSASAPCEKEHPPPSSFNKLCKTFYDKIAKLKKMHDDDQSLEDFDEEFVKEFLLNGTIHTPTETVLIESEVKDLTEKIKSNGTYCFRTDVGEHGWCGTCKKGAKEKEPGYCPECEKGQCTGIENPSEVALPNATDGWGFCHENCDMPSDTIFASQLKKVQLTILDDKICKDLARVKEDNLGHKTVYNTEKEICAGFLQTVNTTKIVYKKEKDKKGHVRYEFKIAAKPKKAKPKNTDSTFRSMRLDNNPGLKDKTDTKLVGGQDTCQGDSGGPLWVMEEDRAVLVGVVSRGRGCAKQHQVGIYTRVKNILPWIYKIASEKKEYEVTPKGGDGEDAVAQPDPCKGAMSPIGTKVEVRPYCKTNFHCPSKDSSDKKSKKKKSRKKKKKKKKKGKKNKKRKRKKKRKKKKKDVKKNF